MFSNLGEKKADSLPKLNMLVYGDFGTGKTTLALSVPADTVYLIDLENGAEMYGKYFDNVKVAKIENVKQLQNTIKALKDIVKETDCVVLDSETTYWNLLQYARAKHAEKAGLEGSNLNLGDWGIIKRLHKNIQQDLINLNCPIIATAQEKTMLDGEGVVRDLSPKTENSTPYFFDLVVRISHGEEGRVLEVGKRRGDVLNKDSYAIEGKTFYDVFKTDFDFEMTKDKLIRNYVAKVMYARKKKDLQLIADAVKADAKLDEKAKELIKKEIKRKADKL